MRPASLRQLWRFRPKSHQKRSPEGLESPARLYEGTSAQNDAVKSELSNSSVYRSTDACCANFPHDNFGDAARFSADRSESPPSAQAEVGPNLVQTALSPEKGFNTPASERRKSQDQSDGLLTCILIDISDPNGDVEANADRNGDLKSCSCTKPE